MAAAASILIHHEGRFSGTPAGESAWSGVCPYAAGLWPSAEGAPRGLWDDASTLSDARPNRTDLQATAVVVSGEQS